MGQEPVQERGFATIPQALAPAEIAVLAAGTQSSASKPPVCVMRSVSRRSHHELVTGGFFLIRAPPQEICLRHVQFDFLVGGSGRETASAGSEPCFEITAKNVPVRLTGCVDEREWRAFNPLSLDDIVYPE
jgi:hypothetical protein